MRRPESELDVIFQIGRHWDQLTARTSLKSITFTDGVFDATGVYDGREVAIEVEMRSSQFNDQEHDPTACDVVICFDDDRELTDWWEELQAIEETYEKGTPQSKAVRNIIDLTDQTYEEYDIELIALNEVLD